MLSVILLAALATGAAEWRSILTPPTDVIGKLGDTAVFTCEVDLSAFPALTWEFNNDPIYSRQYDQEDYPKGDLKYSVVLDGRDSRLTVRDLGYDDGGTYTCGVVKQAEDAHLIVLGSPQLFTPTRNPMEGITAQYVCTAQVGGPIEVSSELSPQVQMFLDGKPLHGLLKDQEPLSETNGYNLRWIQNITLWASMHGRDMKCEITSGTTVLHATTKVEVLYSVRNISYAPRRNHYEVGSMINCSADGNPSPRFFWSDTNTGDLVYGRSLYITEQMVGDNAWTCTADNTVNGQQHVMDTSAAFDVGVSEFPLKSPILSQTGNSSDTWKIAIGVTIPIGLAIACLTAFYFRRKRLRHPMPQTTYTSIPEIAPGEPPQTKEAIRNAHLVKTLSKPHKPEDLSDNYVRSVKELLPPPDETFPVETPSALMVFLRKSKHLVGSDHYYQIVKEMVPIYEKTQNWMREDLLAIVVEKMEKQPSMAQDHFSLLRLLKVIIPLNSTDETRSRCMGILIERSREWQLCRNHMTPGDASPAYSLPLHWDFEFIEILKCLQDKGVDPMWSPEGSTMGSILHVISIVLPLLLVQRLQLFDELKKLLKMMIMSKKNGSPLNAQNASKCTPLHTFLIGVCQMDAKDLTQDFLMRVKDITLLLKSETNVNVKMADSQTILHLVVRAMCLENNKGVHAEFVELLKCLVSLKNINLSSDNDQTALSVFTESVNTWVDHPKFLEVVENLASRENIALRDRLGRTPLQIFSKWGRLWKDSPETFLKVFKCLFPSNPSDAITTKLGDSNAVFDAFQSWSEGLAYHPEALLQIVKILIAPARDARDFQDKDGETMLHKFVCRTEHLETLQEIKYQNSSSDLRNSVFMTSAAVFSLQRNNAFLEIVKLLKSDKNIDMQNSFKDTVLHSFIDKVEKWKDHPESFFKIIRSLISSVNINLKNIQDECPLQKFMFKVDQHSQWNDHAEAFLAEVFLKVLQCLKSSDNVDFVNDTSNTALHIFIVTANEWKDHKKFLEVVNCLRSPSNTAMKNDFGETALHRFISTAHEWSDEPLVYLDVIKSLQSPLNTKERNRRGETALHLFTFNASRWKDHPDVFVDVIRWLRSDANITMENQDGATALSIFESRAGKWDSQARDKVVKYLTK